ncbi:uncharacterized protein sas isoform X2 [Panulirus ornatus]|uniref:uncharacterized protein sas isoform X2 n=1 Tax=Panulirus ornatus TaxID=150431 RepID=UPI003A8C3FE1
MLVTRAVLVAALAPYLLVWAQLGGLQENSTAGGDSCQCTPACEGGVGVGGCSGREVERADCPCCRVCAQEEGKPCSEPYLPCDTKYGLVCSSERVCKAEYPCTLDGDCPGDRFCLGVVCVDPCPILTPCRGTLKGGKCVSKDHRPVCECPAGTLPDSLGQVCVPYNASVAGCEYGGRLYAEGEVRYEGECQQQCRCGSDGAFTCGPVTCPPGLFLAGQHANQELCIELRNRPEADECCVAVACANSLAQPSLLTSPVLADSTHLTQEEHVSSDQYLTALQGRHVGQGHAPPISEEEYQRRLKDLEGELAKKNEKKKIEGKLSEKWELESSRSTSTAAATAAAAEEALGVAHTTTESTGVPQLEISTFAPPEADDLDQQAMGEVLTTLMPMLLEKEHQLTTEEQEAMDEEAAVVVEYDEQGQQVHRITVHHQVDVVTEMTGGALDDEVGVATDATPALEQEEDLATDITPALQQQGDLVTDITPALQQQEDLVTDISPSLQQEEDLATDITPALQQEEKDLVTDITPALQQEEDLATDIPPALQQQEDLFTDISPSLQQEEDLVTDISPLLQQEEDLATDITPALQQEEEDLVTDIPPALQQEEEDLTQSLTREGKMASEENITHPAQLIPEEFPKAESKVGAGALKVREVSHNSSTIVLPSSKGGEVYYKAAESTEWLREIVPAGEESLVLRGLRPSTQYTLKWSSASGGGSAKITIDTEEGCRVHNMSYATGHEWSEGCQQRCSCRPAGAVDCQPRCLFVAGDITDPLCTERPAPEDPECCVVYDCKSVNVTNFQSSTATDIVGLPKLLVTEKTHSSVTLAWDDFRARTYEGGYVAEYREKHSDAAAEAMPEQLWMRKEVPTEELPPRLTVEGLKPNTVYEVRVSIYDDVEEGRLGEATETISVRTEAGCVHGNSSHAVGEFYNGCEETCMCVATGDVRCFERCTLPYFRAGSFKGDPMCSEQPNENDECCVVVLCARDPVAFSQCTNVVCGPNAECISGAVAPKDLSDIDSDLTLGYCHCLQGFTGDASDLVHGCTPDPSAGRKEGSCTFKNSTYRPGDVFYDECDYRCACNNNTEIECEPRCEFPHEDGSETEPGCEYLPDPEDSCCKLRVCNSTSEAATDAARAPSLPSDGCTEGNITYARDEKFYKGCENQCICMGFGDISCYPRCPPLKVVSETPKRCETLPDPQDSCCSITVCDEETPDVMKANITELKDEMKNMTEMEKKMMMREMMMNMTESEKEMMMNMTESEKEMMMKEMISMGGTEKEMDMTEIEEPARNMTALAVEERTSEVDTEMEEEEILSTVMPDGEMLVHTHSPENMNEGHTHKHTHRDGTHTHNDTAEDGQVVDHAHARDMSDWQIQNHDIFNGTHNHTHSHENGIIHTHPHHHNMDNSHDHEHDMDMLHTQAHAHKDGENEWQIQNHDTLSGTHNHTHTHENGITHIHPHLHNNNNAHEHDVDELRSPEHMHSHDHGMDDTHTHEHTHREGTDLTHPHEQDVTQDHTNDTHIHMHTHKDGTTLNHPHDHSVDETQEQEHPQEEIHNHTHMHKDGVIHTHPHDHEMDDHNHTHSSGMDHTHTIDGMDNFQNQTHLNVLEKKNRAEDLGTHDLNILEVIALNATTVVIRLAVSELVMNKIISPDNQQILVLYSPDSLTWSERNISTSDVIKENFNEIALFLNDLQPSTPYQFRVVFQDFVSSTSKATLMDGTINAGIAEVTSSHVGCVAGMEFTEDTECGRHCMCEADGQVICKPRCPHYEVAQLSNTTCTLVPNPDDPCCTIPDCLMNLFSDNVIEKFANFTNDPSVDFEHSVGTMNKTNSAHEDESSVIMHKSQDRNHGSDMFHLVPHRAPDDTIFISETHAEQDNVTESSHPVRNTLIPGEDVASERPWKSFTSLNDLLSKHNQLGTFPHGPSTTSTPKQDRNSDISKNLTKEAFPNLPDNLNHLTASQQNTSLLSAMDVKDTEVTETVREISTPLQSIPRKNSESLAETEDHDSFHLPGVETEEYSNTSSLLLSNGNFTYQPNDNEEGTPLYLPTNIGENEVSLSPHRNESPHSTLFDDYQLDLSTPSDEIKSNISLGLQGNDSVVESPDFTKVELSQGSAILLNDSAHLPYQHSNDSSPFLIDYKENAHLPIEDREGSYLPIENSENISFTHKKDISPPNEKEEDSHIPEVDSFHVPSEHIIHFHSTNSEPSHLHRENRTLTNQLKEQRPPHSFVPTATEDLVHHISEEAPVVVGGDSFTPINNKTDILGRIKDGVDGVDVDTSMKCSHKGRYYKPGQEFYEECSHSCICTESLEVHCAAIECPVTFGLELIDPNCLEWDLDPDYVPTPPKCCPQVKCISSSACQYVGQTFDNYEQIPREITGCSQVCTCNYGNVTCRDLCEPVPPSPPLDLSCDPKDAVLITLPGETCCRSWQCAAHSAAEFEFLGTTEVVETTQFPGDSRGTPAIFPLPPVSVLGGNPSSGFVSVSPSAPPNFGADVIAEPRVSSQDARTAHFFFSTPTLYQGLPGELFFRFTNDPVNHPDPSTWSKEVLVPMGSMISQSEWDHLLTGLDPSTTYTMQLVLTVQGAEPVTSPVFTYTTMEEATTPSTTTPLPHLDITADLYASEVTKTTAKVSWRVFDDFELQYIDGVLVKYTEKDKRIPKFSQMLHRDNNHVYLRDLQPGRSYTVDLDFVTHKNQTTQVSNTKNITFTTLPEEDPYAFDIEVTAGKVSSQTAELFYSGVPEPEEKYVNVYRVVYLREVERIDAQTFKIPKTGQERKIFLSDLKPDIEYQVWLEAYLSNGRKKKSNVLTITTRAGELPKPERSEVDPSAKDSEDGESYYSELVTVAIIAAIACLGFLGLLVILLRKQSHAKAHISSSRNTAAYDNPSYKTYDMEMNGIKGSGNGATHAEEP